MFFSFPTRLQNKHDNFSKLMSEICGCNDITKYLRLKYVCSISHSTHFLETDKVINHSGETGKTAASHNITLVYPI